MVEICKQECFYAKKTGGALSIPMDDFQNYSVSGRILIPQICVQPSILDNRSFCVTANHAGENGQSLERLLSIYNKK